MQVHNRLARFVSIRSSLVLLFLVGLLIRVSGLITYTHGDEPWNKSVRVLAGEISDVGTWPPLIYYLNAASFVVMYAIGRLVGVWHGVADFRAQYFLDPTPFMFAGRFVSACLGAATAPLGALIANRLGLTWGKALSVGLMVALLPHNILASHISKPDIGSAAAVLFLAWSILRKSDDPEARGSDALVGVALAISLSFKQTAILVTAPLMVGYLIMLRWDSKLTWWRIGRGLFGSLAFCVLAWVPMNIGLIVGLEGFLRFQRHQLMTQRRTGSAYQIAKGVVPVLAGNFDGLTAAGLLGWLIAPFIRRDRKFLLLWGSTAVAFVAFSALAGTGAGGRARDFLSSGELAFVLACIGALSLASRERSTRFAGWALTAAVVACLLIATVEVERQAVAPPITERAAEVIKSIAKPEREKILAAWRFQLGVPVSAAALTEEHERHERLAKKYGLSLGQRAKERTSSQDDGPRGYFIRDFPAVSGGLEDMPPEEAAKVAVPYVWPLQDEEYDLDYWTAQGFTIFVVVNEDFFANCSIPQYRTIHRQIMDRCELVTVVPTTRPLFFEQNIKIYRFIPPGSGTGTK